MNTAIATRMDIDNNDGVPAEVLNALANIRASLRIQAARGNKDAESILKHL